MNRFARCPLILLLAGCTVGPDYHTPDLSLGDQWNTPKPAIAEAAPMPAQTPWWIAMHDPTLDALMTRALAANEDRKIAEARILEARGLRRSSASSLYPSVDLGAAAQRAGSSLQTFNGNLDLYQTSFDASYELDLFGGNRRAVEAADAVIGAQVAAYHALSLTLTAEVAREYIAYRELQHQLALAKKTASAQQNLQRISSDKFNAGLVSVLDRDQADTLKTTTQARIPDIERQLAASSNRLAVLLGEIPGTLSAELNHTEHMPPALPLPVLSAPSDTIRNRPDVMRAERELAAATALQGVAISAQYPKVSLGALFGLQYASLPIMDFLATGHMWSLGGAVSMPLLEFGGIEGQIDAADARQQQALHNYRKTVLTALEEVETGLSNLKHENERRLALAQATQTASHAVSVARSNYRDGLSDFTAVLQAEQQSYATERDLVTSQGMLVQYVIALHKAIGSPVEAPAKP